MGLLVGLIVGAVVSAVVSLLIDAFEAVVDAAEEFYDHVVGDCTEECPYGDGLDDIVIQPVPPEEIIIEPLPPEEESNAQSRVEYASDIQANNNRQYAQCAFGDNPDVDMKEWQKKYIDCSGYIREIDAKTDQIFKEGEYTGGGASQMAKELYYEHTYSWNIANAAVGDYIFFTAADQRNSSLEVKFSKIRHVGIVHSVDGAQITIISAEVNGSKYTVETCSVTPVEEGSEASQSLTYAILDAEGDLGTTNYFVMLGRPEGIGEIK